MTLAISWVSVARLDGSIYHWISALTGERLHEPQNVQDYGGTHGSAPEYRQYC
jgi:hypothetical protein